MTRPIEQSQRNAAKVVGFVYLFAMALGMFSELFARGTLIVWGDAATTAQNILASEALFRAGIACEILTFAADLALISALYVILAPIHRPLALYASLLRVVAAAVSVAMAAGSFDVLRLLGGADYLHAFEADQLAALAHVRLGSHGSAYRVAFVFLGLGSAVFAFLWWRSRYVPRAMAALGVVASLMLAGGNLAILMTPALARTLDPGFMVPMFFFEVGMGVLLLVRGLKASPELPRATAPREA